MDAWQLATAAGAALLNPQFADAPDVNWNALHANLAEAYSSLAVAAFAVADVPEAVAAIETAIALQPDNAHYHATRAAELIAIGRLDDAEAALTQARTLDGTLPQLAGVLQQLTEARASQRAEHP